MTETLREPGTTSNVLAEKTGKNADNVVMAGAHLDSVPAGPGINDNGSGSAALLEVAEQMAKVKPQNTLRFAWWGAEEASLVGSTCYVNTLSQTEWAKIALYLNFDMVGSPNHVFFIYDGDNSDGVGRRPGPAGSAQIEKKFEEFFNSRGIPFKGTDFSGRSDYGPSSSDRHPVRAACSPEPKGIKTAEEAASVGRHCRPAVRPLLPPGMRHLRQRQRLFALDTNSDAIAYATLSYAMSTEEINGTKSKGNFKPLEQSSRRPIAELQSGEGRSSDRPSLSTAVRALSGSRDARCADDTTGSTSSSRDGRACWSCSWW